ncbi:unnamed protein product [Mytilus coruscus]|uniref:Ig-like domain-containing protein n=1 Tax=Mytilus coruscus TaxID=42192 RepID=A0A6J8EFF0_MYTCO|nr:unnamed protein product [Mytilus coruscus]
MVQILSSYVQWEGEYMCTVREKTPDPTTWTTEPVFIKYTTSSKITDYKYDRNLKLQFLVNGTDFQYECIATGIPKPNITWTKEGDEQFLSVNTKWAVGVFNQWRSFRTQNKDAIIELHMMNAECMNYWLERFVMETRKQNGDEYPPKSLYYIVCGLLRHCRDMNVHDKNFLDQKDGRFAHFRRVLDAKMKDLLSKGLGTKVRRADPVSDDDEEKLWANGVFGTTNSSTLQYTVFFYNCKLFGLRGRDEHRNLDHSQFETGQDATGRFVRFIGRNNKTFKGGLDNKDIKHYASGPRCIVDYYETYLKAIGSGVFYRKPLISDVQDKHRYGKSPLGGPLLHFPSITKAENGGYVCIAENRVGREKGVRQWIEVSRYKPTIKYNSVPIRTVTEYEINEHWVDGKMQVLVHGCPHPTVTWWKESENGRKQITEEKIVMNTALSYTMDWTSLVIEILSKIQNIA